MATIVDGASIEAMPANGPLGGFLLYGTPDHESGRRVITPLPAFLVEAEG